MCQSGRKRLHEKLFTLWRFGEKNHKRTHFTTYGLCQICQVKINCILRMNRSFYSFFIIQKILNLYNVNCSVFLLLLALLHDDKNYTIARLTCLATYINTIFILGNMFQALDLQNIFNPFNGTLIERKQDTWSFLKTRNVFRSQRDSPSRLVFISMPSSYHTQNHFYSWK